LLSALAKVPVRQDVAVTGSLNQFGDIQPVGGINEKIEGFFQVCKAQGLHGDQGVLIPQANASHLMLHSSVIKAVAAGDFHIYTYSHIDQALAVLMDRPAGTADEAGHFPSGSVNAMVMQSLAHMNAKQETSD